MNLDVNVVWYIEVGDDSYSDFHRATLDWVRSLRLDGNWLAPEAAVVKVGDRYELHVDEIARRDGKVVPDPMNRDELLKFRKVVDVAEGSWPEMPERVIGPVVAK